MFSRNFVYDLNTQNTHEIIVCNDLCTGIMWRENLILHQI